jgi:SpoVK/Ycf46/Vps4 family AAA+-type ATPase
MEDSNLKIHIEKFKLNAHSLHSLLGVDSPDLDSQIHDCIESSKASWSQGKLRTHKRMKLPVDVWARLSATLGGSIGNEDYRRFLPPVPLRYLSAAILENDDVRQIARDLIDNWTQIQKELATSANASALYHEFIGLVLDQGWEKWIDVGDAPTKPALSLKNLDYSLLDASTRSALAQLPASLPNEERLLLLAGAWSGAQAYPRLSEDWNACESWIKNGDHKVKSIQDLGAARVWTMSKSSPIYQTTDTQVFDDFLAWANRRASTWPTYNSIDGAIHSRLREASDAEVSDDSLIPDWVRSAVTNGRLDSPSPSVVIVRNAPSVDSLLEEMKALVGLDDLKAEISKIVNLIKLERIRESEGHNPSPIELNMVFTGNPGTGKTTVARIYGQILKALGVLEGGEFVEVTRVDLVGGYLGQSAIKTAKVIDRAMGGVLFIDEAYSLAPSEDDQYGTEVIAEIVASMERHRGKIAVIVAGYGQEMHKFMDSNSGLRSRFRDPINFPDLGGDALLEALVAMGTSEGYSFDQDAISALKNHINKIPREKGFGNVRDMRKLYSRLRESLAARHSENSNEVDYNVIRASDVPSIAPGKFNGEQYQVELTKLNSLIGLAPVKTALGQLAAQAHVATAVHAQGMQAGNFNIGHMAFLGRPGTGKTTVADQVGRMFAAMGLLKSGHVVLASRSTLVAPYIGQTAPKVREAIQSALGGVLFIDEAYALTPFDGKDFGHEAIATLIDGMERHRGEFVVVMAGYEAEMLEFIETNPGLDSRVRHKIMFPDFSRDELLAITNSIVASTHHQITEEAAEAIANQAASLSNEPNFANARTVRNIIDDSKAAMSQRLVDAGLNNVDPKDLILITKQDFEAASKQPRSQIGFGFAPIQ